MRRILDIAYRACGSSTHPVHKMAAVVVRGGRVVSVAHNLRRRYGHCETRALRPHSDLCGATIVVVRSNGGCSRPCPRCRRAIEEAGIKKVVYVDERGEVAVERV